VSVAGAVSGSVDYLAPQTVPSSNPVTLEATSAADTTKSATALVTIQAPPQNISVTVFPSYVFLEPSAATPSTQQFTATVSGSTSAGVNWSVASAVTGHGCTAAACGTVDQTGLYTAPQTAPSPNAIAVAATSQQDGTKSASATIVILSGPAIETLLPSSVEAGAVEGFPLEVRGANFVAGSGGTGSTILLNGAARATTCTTAESCTIALDPADVMAAGTTSIQVQNPGSPGALSNPVPFVVVPFVTSPEVIALSARTPSVTNLSFVLAEPTTAAASSPINVDSIGPLTGGNNCTFGAAPVMVTRPASGTETVSLCVHGNALDASFAYVFTGPGAGDIAVTATPVSGLFPNTIELDLQISSSTLPGLRTLFITTLDGDRAAATGMLEVQ
jgi:hypothetical protein